MPTFAPSTGTSLASQRCHRCQGALEPDDLRCPVCTLITPAGRQDTKTEKAAAAVIRCRGCKASVAYSAEVKAPHCAYCGTIMALEVPEDPIEQAQAFLPFEVDGAGAREALRSFLRGKRWFRPSDLVSAATLDSLQPIWWPAWIVNAEALASWTADSNAGARQAAWAPHAGQSPLLLRNVVVSASRGLSEEECVALAADYDLNRAAATPRGPEGAQVERFDMPRSAARKRIQESIEAVAEASVKAGEIPGSSFRNVKVATVLTGLETTRYALPAFVLAYRYREKLFRAVVHGQKADRVIGDAPYSILKILAAIGGGLLGLAALGALIYFLFSA